MNAEGAGLEIMARDAELPAGAERDQLQLTASCAGFGQPGGIHTRIEISYDAGISACEKCQQRKVSAVGWS